MRSMSSQRAILAMLCHSKIFSLPVQQERHSLVDIISKAMGLFHTYGTYFLQHNIHITY